MTLIIAGLFAAILVSGCIAPLISQTETPANSSLQFVSSYENGDLMKDRMQKKYLSSIREL